MNSGSESVTVALRISDVNAKLQTDTGARHAGKKIVFLAFSGGFHGRTDRPSQASSSSMPKYQALASFRDRKNLVTIEPNNIQQLRDVFIRAEKEQFFIECALFEPVMGEGNPGLGLTPEFYAAARQLTRDHGAFLLIDSIQAGLRAHGVLSIVDYPGFQSLEAPDFETYSKALNAGQFPLSILALSAEAGRHYQTGIYGNTMTTNPRALEVACAVFDEITPELRSNICERGREFVDKFQHLALQSRGAITKVQGTGLLFCAELDPQVFRAEGPQSLETFLRKKGIGVIHGGKNALRFTPHFRITTEEIDLIVDQVREALESAPRLQNQQQDLANQPKGKIA